MFTFTKNGIAIVFGQYGLGPYTAAILYFSIIKEPYPQRDMAPYFYHTNRPTIAALSKDTAIPLTSSFHTFFPMTVDFSPSRIELYVP